MIFMQYLAYILRALITFLMPKGILYFPGKLLFHFGKRMWEWTYKPNVEAEHVLRGTYCNFYTKYKSQEYFVENNMEIVNHYSRGNLTHGLVNSINALI